MGILDVYIYIYIHTQHGIQLIVASDTRITARRCVLPGGFKCRLNMFAATSRFARGQSRISFDMLKSLRRVLVFYFPKQQTPKP